MATGIAPAFQDRGLVQQLAVIGTDGGDEPGVRRDGGLQPVEPVAEAGDRPAVHIGVAAIEQRRDAAALEVPDQGRIGLPVRLVIGAERQRGHREHGAGEIGDFDIGAHGEAPVREGMPAARGRQAG
jgi:hypothetical protein